MFLPGATPKKVFFWIRLSILDYYIVWGNPCFVTIFSKNGLFEVKEEGRTGFSGWSAPRDFPRAKPERSPCIQFIIGFHIDPPKMHRRFHIGLPKIHRRFPIGHPKIHRGFRIGLLRLPSIFSCQNSTDGQFWCTMAIMQEK